MNDDLQATHAELLGQVRGIMEALSQMTEPERDELLAQAEALVANLEGMKV